MWAQLAAHAFLGVRRESDYSLLANLSNGYKKTQPITVSENNENNEHLNGCIETMAMKAVTEMKMKIISKAISKIINEAANLSKHQQINVAEIMSQSCGNEIISMKMKESNLMAQPVINEN